MTVEQLYEIYFQELVNWCETMAGSLQTAEELVQEAFFKALQNEEILCKLTQAQARSWLYRTTKNLFIDQVRHRGKETIVEIMPEPIQEQKEIQEFEWEEVLNRLPDAEGVLFTLRYIEGYNSKQIGQLFSMPEGTVRSKLSLARKHLRQALAVNDT